MTSLLADAAARAQNYVATLPERPVAPVDSDVARLSMFD
jgi:hypothetical protein